MFELLHSTIVDGESWPAGTRIEYLGPAAPMRRGQERVHVRRVEDGLEAEIDASAVSADVLIYRGLDVWYRDVASFLAGSVGGYPGDAENWLRDGDAQPGDNVEELREEWRSIGCEYVA